MNELKAFFQNPQARLEWANFISETMNSEVLKRVYAGKDIAGYQQAREIVAQSFRELDEIFNPKPKPRPRKGSE